MTVVTFDGGVGRPCSRLEGTCPHITSLPFSSRHGLVSAIRAVGKRRLLLAGNNPSIIFKHDAGILVSKRIIPLAGRVLRGVGRGGRRFSSHTLHMLTFTCQPVRTTRTLSFSTRRSLVLIKLVTVVSPPHRRICNTITRTGGTNVGAIVVANSRGAATHTVTHSVNVSKRSSLTLAKRRLSGLDSQRLSTILRHMSICTQMSPRGGVQVIHT